MRILFSRRSLIAWGAAHGLSGQSFALELVAPSVASSTETTKTDSLAALAATPRALCRGVCFTLGYYQRFDGGGNQFYWDPESTLDDDWPLVVKPTDSNAAGRWIVVLDPAEDVNLLRFGLRAKAPEFDNGARVNVAMRWARAQGGARFLYPRGIYFFASTVHVPPNTKLSGGGAQSSIWRRAGGTRNDYGHTVVIGDPKTRTCDSVEISDIWFLQPIGYESFDVRPWDPAAQIKQDSAHFLVYGLRYSTFRRVLAWNMRFVVCVVGGADVTWEQCRFRGYWDGEGVADGGRLGGGTNHTYAIFYFKASSIHGHPETMSVVDCTMSGYKRSRTYRAVSGKAERAISGMTENIGPKSAVHIEAGEGLTFRGGIADAGHDYLFSFMPKPGVPLLQTTIDMFVDSAGTSAIQFDNGGLAASAVGVRISGSINGENSGTHAVLAEHTGSPRPSVIDLEIDAQIKNHRASAIRLNSVERFRISGEIVAWNWAGVYASDPEMASAIWIGGITKYGLIDNLVVGGGPHAQPIDPSLPPGAVRRSDDAGKEVYGANQCAYAISFDANPDRHVVKVGNVLADPAFVHSPGLNMEWSRYR